MPGNNVERGVRCKYGHDEWFESWDSKREKTRWVCAACERRRWRERHQSDPSRSLLKDAKRRAANKGVPFDITLEDVKAVWPQDGQCPILGLTIKPSVGRIAPYSPSLDRIEPEKGYVRGNIVIVSSRANTLKNSATVAELEAVLTWMRNNGAN